jgi:hypothetical protein
MWFPRIKSEITASYGTSVRPASVPIIDGPAEPASALAAKGLDRCGLSRAARGTHHILRTRYGSFYEMGGSLCGN